MPSEALVGRTGERALLRDLVRGAVDGRFGAVVLHGEAGIGKTTLARSAAAEAGRGALLLAGTCLPLTSVAVPLMGLRSALRGVPESSRPVLPGTPDAAAGPLPVLFDDWLTARARDTPVVLTLDDLQWADPETLDVLMYVLAGPPERRLAVVLTCRSGEAGEHHPLQRWLADARRLPGVTELSLGALSRDAMADQIAGVMGEPPHASLVDEVYARSRGNPYFARLLVNGVPASARALPEHLPKELGAAAVRSWLGLSEPTRRLLVAMAVGGRPVAGRSLARAADVADLSDPRPALQEAVDAGLLDVQADRWYWFHHPLQAEALEQRLLPEHRRVLHSGFAAGYAEDVEDGLTPELAETVSDHHVLADEPAAAYDWALTAAHEMDRSRDRAGMLRMLRRAAALHRVARRDPEALRDLLTDIRRLASEVADWEAELEAIEGLRAMVDAKEDSLTLAELDVAASRLRHRMNLEDPVGLARALRITAEAVAGPQRVVARCEQARRALWSGRLDEAREAMSEVRAILRTHPMPSGSEPKAETGWARARVSAETQEAMLAVFEGDAGAATLHASRAERGAAALHDGELMTLAILWGASAVPYPVRAWVEELSRGRLAMERLNIPQPYIARVSGTEALGWFDLGDPESSVERLRVALGTGAPQAGSISARLTAALLSSWQGRQTEAEAHLARAIELSAGGPESLSHFHVDVVTAAVQLDGGSPEASLKTAEAALARSGNGPPRGERLAPLAARALADLVAAERDTGGDPSGQMQRLADLRERVPRVIPEGGPPSPAYDAVLGALDLLYAAETARAMEPGSAGPAWCAAAEALASAEMPWEHSYAAWRAGEALLVGGAPAERRVAAEMLRRGYALAVRLEARRVQREIESLAQAARITLAEVSTVADAGRGAMALTPREREVLAHVVAGRTYAEIATALFLSEKTVSSHISNILRKTGTANRVELAAWATRRGASS